MASQYKLKKEKLLSYLIDELTASSIRSVYSFRIISLALSKFYPEMVKKKPVRYKKEYKELKSLESTLMAAG